MGKRHTHLVWLVIILLIAAWLRIHGLSDMTNMLHHDEAYYGIDAVSLLEHPRLTAYFPNNTGREGLWMYLLAPSVAIFGATPFALRLVSMFVGVLSVAAMYPLAREFIGKRGAVWAVGALAVLYWHVHLSHIAFRANIFPLVGALAMAALLRASRTNRGWVVAGLWIGLLLYTYIAARVWVAYALLCLVLWGIVALINHVRQSKTDKTCLVPTKESVAMAYMPSANNKIKHIFLTLIIIAIMSIPLLVALSTPAETTASISRAAADGWHEIQLNIRNWVAAWLISGDPNPTHNLPERPVLDIPLACLAILGIVGMWFVIRKKWLIIWWLGLVVVSFIPTLLSTATPHYLRGLGVLMPLALLIGAGGVFLCNSLEHISRRKNLCVLCASVVLCFFLWSGINTYRDFDLWFADETPGIYIDDRFNESMAIVRDETPPEMPIMIPGIVYHPVAAFHGAGMPQRDARFYVWNEGDCYVTPRERYVAVDLPIHLERFEERAAQYSESIEAVARHPEQEYNVFIVQPHDDLIADWDDSVRLGERVEVQLVEPLLETIRAGDTLTLYIGIRSHQTLDTEQRLFVHLQKQPTPYEGGTQWATGDIPLCPQVYDPQWTTQQTIIQPVTLSLPDDLPTDDYHIAIGLYDPNTGERLSVSPSENAYDYYTLFEFSLE